VGLHRQKLNSRASKVYLYFLGRPGGLSPLAFFDRLKKALKKELKQMAQSLAQVSAIGEISGLFPGSEVYSIYYMT